MTDSAQVKVDLQTETEPWFLPDELYCVVEFRMLEEEEEVKKGQQVGNGLGRRKRTCWAARKSQAHRPTGTAILILGEARIQNHHALIRYENNLVSWVQIKLHVMMPSLSPLTLPPVVCISFTLLL